ncbi:hypothetical protein EDB87DRAFT_1555949, partial [Lactarius vividus]
KVLTRFLREVEAFHLDHGHEVGHQWDERIDSFCLGLENLLINHHDQPRGSRH